MSAGTSRGWMNRRMHDGYLSEEFCNGVDSFLDCAFSNDLEVERYSIDGRTVLRIRCPCTKCAHRNHKTRPEVELDLMQFGFMGDSTSQEPTQHLQQSSNPIECDEVDGCTQMVLDNMAPRLSNTWQEQEPNPQAKRFYEMLEAADQPLWDGFDKCSQLQAAARFLNLKAKCNIPDTTYNRILSMIKETLLPEGERLVGSLYETKNMLKPLWLPKERIHACKNHCMLFYKEKADYTSCRVCGEPRYKKNGNKVPNLVLTYLPVAPRLQRLYMCAKTAKEMTWHHNHQTEEGKMAHPSDGKAWKHFNRLHPDFAQEIRNVRLGLCTDGFNPNISSSNPYSLWPVFVTNYNLPPWLGLKECYIHLALVIPGRKSPGQNLDVFLRPLIDELKMLYNEGVTTYDASQRTNFTMRAILLWTVSDFPAYAMLSGWSTHGKLDCPYCMDKADSFQLQSGGKSCWFDCHRKFLRSGHPFRRDKVRFRARNIVIVRKPPELTGYDIWEQVRHLPTVYDGVPYKPQNRKPLGFGETHNWVKRSIFWELPYWKTLLIRHNLDVMHIEKNVFDNLFHTIMDTSKTKDNVKAREDVEHYCNRPELHMVRSNTRVLKPKASYTLSRRQVHTICEWLKELRFPDNYASNIGGCVNIKDGSFYGFKSHDCHIFMQRLLPIAIRGMVPNPIWDAITELCTFFRVICSRVLHMVDLIRLKDSIVETICKLERIFPPGFFDSMEHLVIHLADEAILGGPVQYRWMYLYERRLGSLKRTVRNKARIEGSIIESYLVNELSTYCSIYFDPTVETRLNREARNFAPDIPCFSGMDSRLSIFKVPCKRLFEKSGKQVLLNNADFKKAHTYILLNCKDVIPFIYKFDDWVRSSQPYISDANLDHLREENFADWFENHVMFGSDSSTNHLKVLAQGPIRYALVHSGYIVNGYKFHTKTHGHGRVTANSGVCVKGSCYNDDERDYYGTLDEILEIEYHGEGRCVVVLFRCTWFDTIHGIKVDRKHNLVDIKHKSRLGTDDPFVLASQAQQVYYAPYPSKDMKDWWAVVKTHPRGIYQLASTEVPANDDVANEQFFQENERLEHATSTSTNATTDEPVCLVTEAEYAEVVTNQGDTWHVEESSDEEEEYDESDNDSDDDDDETLNLSDHPSDE